MALRTHAAAEMGGTLSPETVQQTLATGLQQHYSKQRVLVLIPDHTRSLPLPLLFRSVVDALSDTQQLDFMVALGTHPPLDDDALCRLVGITPAERETTFSHVGLLNHDWQNPDTLTQIGTLTAARIQAIAGSHWHSSLGGDVPVRINRAVHDYDHILILGPTFPHEVVGFSGGAKYLFPGISGHEMIDVSHWLGALIGVIDTIGIADTPVRQMIHAATTFVQTPLTLVSLVVVEDKKLAGLFIGDHIQAWEAAASLSRERHICWLDAPLQRVLSRAPTMYDELWTAAKAMYKLEPAIADGGEVIVYAPHLNTVSHVHGNDIYEAGYHVRDFFLKQWDDYRHLPRGVLAHGTHLKGAGTYENGQETPRIQVTLASQVPPDDCERLNLGYMNPADIHPADWQNREDDGVLYVPKAGETLYRVRS